MSAAPEDLQKTLEEAGRQISSELREAERLKNGLESGASDREKIVLESLEKAKNYYKKKDYARAFAEWERACSVLGEGDGFRRKVRELKESHENLTKVNRELLELKEALSLRAAPSASDKKFVQDSHEATSTQVKNVYSHLSQQLRTDRSASSAAPWWPVLAALLVVAAGFAGLFAYHTSASKRTAVIPAQASAAAPVDDMFLQAERNAMEKQVHALNEEHGKQIDELNRKHAQDSIDDREKIVQLETKLKEAEAKNSDLERQMQLLLEDNLSKDKALSALS